MGRYYFAVVQDGELAERVRSLRAGARREFVCVADDLDTWAPARRGYRGPAGDAAAVEVRKLFGPLALAAETHREHLEKIVDAGGLVRVSANPLPSEVILVDRRVAVLAGRGRARTREYTVTDSPGVVDSLSTLIDAAWRTADDLDIDPPQDEAGPLGAAAGSVLATLAAGLTDEVAARQLGLSLRTYRRRVAELMATLGATSRFQAGMRAATLGRRAAEP
jgi:hypothetical protein